MRKAAVAIFLCLLLGCATERPLTVAGSSCMGKLMERLSKGYKTCGGEKISVQLGGTQTGLLALQDGVCDIASCSRELKSREKEQLFVFPVAMDAIAVIVHPGTGISGLSLEQLKAVYGKNVLNWRELGGADLPIVTLGRESASGTREIFESAIGLTGVKYDQEHCETGILRESVANTRGAVGYIAFDYVNNSVNVAAVNGVLPDISSVSSGSYPITRVFYLCTRKGDSDERIKRFFSFIESDDGREVIEKTGIVPIKRVNRYD